MSAAPGWQPVTHACRTCGGRIFQCGNAYWCGGCGAQAERTPAPICGCGLKLAGKQAFHCIANPAQTAQSPHAVVIRRGAPPRNMS